MADPRPIGVFDSGVGGLSVLREIIRRLPHEDVVYVADTIHCPYGPRPLEEIRRLSYAVTRFLLAQEAKLIVVACNTASAAALRWLRQRFDVPFVGMVPAVKPASTQTHTGVVGVLATPATVQGDLYAEVVRRFASNVRVVQSTGAGLVEAVEAGRLEDAETEALLRRHLAPLTAAHADTIVLGCTHYSFLRPLIRRVVGPEVTILDPAPAVARQTERVLRAQALVAQRECPGQRRYFTSGDVSRFAALVRRFMGETVPEVQSVCG